MVSRGLLSFNSKFTFNRINLLIFLNRERPFVGIEIKKITSQRKCSLMSKQISLYEKLLVDKKKNILLILLIIFTWLLLIQSDGPQF